MPMAFKRPQLPPAGRLLRHSSRITPVRQGSICFFCSMAQSSGARPKSKRDLPHLRPYSTTTSTAPADPRVELEQTLVEIQHKYPSLIHFSRLQLALQSLRQEPGDEAVRVAVLGLANGAHNGGTTARRVLRALLADPLKDEESWEREMENHDPTRPLIVRVEPLESAGEASTLTVAGAHLLPELRVASAELKNSKLELLLMDIDPTPETPADESAVPSVQEALLVPSVEIADGEDRVTPVTTPVHMALLVAEGLPGAIGLSNLAIPKLDETIKTAVNMEEVSNDHLGASFDVLDVAKAERGVSLFRDGPQHGMQYERLWFASKVPNIFSWLRSSVQANDGTTKPAVRQLLTSIVHTASVSIQEQESRNLSRGIQSAVSSSAAAPLYAGLAQWSQNAHAELQSELDVAFGSRRWRKLGWWKLFWRVDDVAMLTNETLSQRFLPTAEQELVYLTGRIAEKQSGTPEYEQPRSSRQGLQDKRSLSSGQDALVPFSNSNAFTKWPAHIAFTRQYLQNETVPALQALAQRLVAQSIGTSSIAASLAALLYVSSSVSTLYEAGAVAAVGIVYSLGRMQKKWETARDFWEGEVREEGRKAVRAAEESVARGVNGSKAEEDTKEALAEMEKARDLVTKAGDALARMK